MRTFSRREIRSSLRQKGFEQDNNDHAFFSFGEDTHGTVFTMVSHGPGGEDEIQDNLHKMARQIHLSSSQFENFIGCDLSYEGYRDVLINKGYLPDPTPDQADPLPDEMYEEVGDRLFEIMQNGQLRGELHETLGELWRDKEKRDLTIDDLEELERLEEAAF